MDERNTGFKLETAQDGSMVPCLNGVYLHSMFEPLKEAKAFIEKYQDKISKNNFVLIFGLGFGYHVDEVAKLNPTAKIIIIEAHQAVIEACLAKRSFGSNTQIYCCEDPSSIYNNQEFVNFLMSRPVIIRHEASFLMAPDSYKKFLAYRAKEKVSQYKGLIEQRFLDRLNLDESLTLEENLKSTRQRRTELNSGHMLQLAFQEILNQQGQGNI